MKKHLLVISQYFYPEQFRINDLCQEWVKRGYEVTVVTGIPNYPAGKFYDGYGWFKRRKEEYEGIRIIRLPLIPRGHNSLMLALNYASFVVSGWFWSHFTRIKADKIFMFEVSPMTQALLGVWYKKRRKIPCYLYVQDLWPENVEIVTGIHNKKIIHAIDKMVDYIYQNCNVIFATSPSFVKNIEERKSAWKVSGGKKKSKVVYWPQYAEEFYQPAKRESLTDMPENDKFKIVFTGNIGYAQGLDILPKTAAILKEKGICCDFVIIGDGRYREALEQEISKANVKEMFHLLGRKQPDQIPAYLAWCDAAFISFADNPLFEKTIPAKLQSYMACGMPILAAASGETKRILKEAGAGLSCKIGNAEALAEKIVQMSRLKKEELETMGKNSLEYCRREFGKEMLVGEMERYLQK